MIMPTRPYQERIGLTCLARGLALTNKPVSDCTHGVHLKDIVRRKNDSST